MVFFWKAAKPAYKNLMVGGDFIITRTISIVIIIIIISQYKTLECCPHYEY